MKKLLHQKQFVAREHYFLPQDDQSDTQYQNERQFYQEKEKKSRIQINNFTENMNIKINIEIDNKDFSQLEIVSSPAKWKKPVKNIVKQVNQRRVSLQNPYLFRVVEDSMKISNQNSHLVHTPIKNPQYINNNNNIYNNASTQNAKPISRLNYSNKQSLMQRPKQENFFRSNMKNKRYYNTEVFSPFLQKQGQKKLENFQQTNDNLSQRSNQFTNQSYGQNNTLIQKPFFSGWKASKVDIELQGKNQMDQQEVRVKKQVKQDQLSGKILIREQISLDYPSSQNSKKRLKDMILDNSEKEVESQIYIQNQQPMYQFSFETGMQEYFFHRFVNDDENRSGSSDSGICQQNASDEQKLNSPQIQVKNVMKPSIDETDETYKPNDANRIDFQPQKYDRSQNEERINFFDEMTPKSIRQIELQMYEFTEPQLMNYSDKVANEQNQQEAFTYDQKQSMRSLRDGQADKSSEIDKLRQSQIQSHQERDMDEKKTFIQFPHEDHPHSAKPLQQVFKIQHPQQQQEIQTSNEEIYGVVSSNQQEFIIIQKQSQESQHNQQLTFTFSPEQNNQLEPEQQQIQNVNETAPKINSHFSQNSPPPKKYINTLNKSKNRISQQGYSKRSRSKSKDPFIPFSHKLKAHHHKQHCLEPPKPQSFIFKDYSSKSKMTYQNYEPSNLSERSSILQEQKIKKVTPEKKPKVVKVNLVNKKAEDLFTKHKNQFLNKLKMKQNFSNQTVFTQQKNREKSLSKKPHLNQTQNVESISPYVKQLSQRLSSHHLGPVCEHYQKHSKRQLRQRFFSLIAENHGKLFKQYYLSNDELHEIFVSQILNKEMNENYWIEIVKRQGEIKLQNLRRRFKSNYHSNQRSIIKKQQVAADTKRAYPFAISVLNNSLQKVRTY